MKTLSKDVLKSRDQLILALEDAKSEVETAINEFNGELTRLGQLVNMAVAKYNAILADVEAMQSDAQQEVQDFIDGKPEKWQESEKGEAYGDWYSELGDLGFDRLDIEIPDAIEEPDFGALDNLKDEFPIEFTG
jgi:hypothetical protein